MDLIDKYILEYSENFVFNFSEHISKNIFDVEIEMIIFMFVPPLYNKTKRDIQSFQFAPMIFGVDVRIS